MSTSLEIAGLTHGFGAQPVLADVSVTFERGCLYGVTGPNGAGKSTLLKIIAGLLKPWHGQLVLEGRLLSEFTPAAMRRAGIAYIAQDLTLIETWTVEDQLAFELRDERQVRRARRLLEEFGAPGLTGPVSSLAIEQKQVLEIAKGLAREARVILLDEPTTGLDPAQRDSLYRHVQAQTSGGAFALAVSHDLERLRASADRFASVSDGAVEIRSDLPTPRQADPEAPALVQPSDFVRLSFGERADIAVSRGEILGVTGTLRSGVQDFLRRAYGLSDTGADVALQGQSWKASLRNSKRHRVAYISRDRRREWGFDDRSLSFNLAIRSLTSTSPLNLVSERSEDREAAALIRSAGIRPEQPRLPFGAFSGGNRQKAIVAATLAQAPSVVLMDEPLSGIDTEARALLRASLEAYRSRGGAGIVYSQETEDLRRLCDRVTTFS